MKKAFIEGFLKGLKKGFTVSVLAYLGVGLLLALINKLTNPGA